MFDHLTPDHILNDHLGGLALLNAHDLLLVVLSFVVSLFAAVAAVTTVRNARGQGRQTWLLAGSVAYGFGVWAMHFAGMSAMQIGTVVAYDLPITLGSVVFSVVGAYAAFAIVTRPGPRVVRAVVGGTLLGAGIGGMHYAGMLAIRTDAIMRFDYAMVAVSVLVAVAIGVLAMWAFIALQNRPTQGRRIFAMALAGMTIPLMHYTAMIATNFSQIGDMGVVTTDGTINLNIILLIAVVCVSIPLVLTSFSKRAGATSPARA